MLMMNENNNQYTYCSQNWYKIVTKKSIKTNESAFVERFFFFFATSVLLLCVCRVYLYEDSVGCAGSLGIYTHIQNILQGFK